MMTLFAVSDRAAYTVWWASLAIGLVVIVVVAMLLTLIVRTARVIDGAVGQIWVVGQKIANNTVHIPLLHRTNQIVDEILVHAVAVDAAAAAIEAHAEGCPGCPQCVRPGGVRGLA
jgi:hypothetical protein